MAEPMLQLPVYVLAGGRSVRFGADKARVAVGDASLIECAIRALAPAASRMTLIVGEAGRYADLGIREIVDVKPGLGPMGGLLTALEDAGPEAWFLLTACDWAGLRPEWVERLAQGRGGNAAGVIFGGVRPEPLFGLYHGAIRSSVEECVAAGRLAMAALIESAPVRILPPPEDWDQAANINTPDDLERWRRSSG